MSLSYLKDKYLTDTKGNFYKVAYIRKFCYKKAYIKVDCKLTDMKTNKEIALWAMDYSDFVLTFYVPNPYVTEVLFGSNKESKEGTTKT